MAQIAKTEDGGINMTTEQKAKAYDEALEIAREWYNNPNSSSVGKAYLYAVFPELKENEDERMRNIAIYACKYMVDNFENSTKQYEDAIAWLEKQSNKPQGKSAFEAIKEVKVDNTNNAFCPVSVNLMCSKITPATKEQRDLLFSKMKEAGYELDAERKV